MSADHVLEQLRLIGAENAKRDLEFALLRADFTAFRDIANTQLSAIVRLLGTQTDALHAINDRLLALQRSQDGEL